MAPPRPRHVVVVGGGISGVTAAWSLRAALGDAVRVTLLEAGVAVGGKLRVSDLAGLPVDEGAESMLWRRPEAVDLARAVGLGDALVHPATTGASVWTRGRLRPLPGRTVMGVPADLRPLVAGGLLSPAGVARAALDTVLPGRPHEGDVAVGHLVRHRMGGQVVDRLVEPMLGGVYAGRADELSLRATVPQLAHQVARTRSLLAAVRRAAPPPARETPPYLFAGLRGGVGRLPGAVARASGAEVRTGVTVREVTRLPDGTWRLVTGPVPDPQVFEADAVVLAVPAAPAARLLAGVAPVAAHELAVVEHASVAVVSLAMAGADVPGPWRGTGFLVPPSEGRMVKAATFSSAKWSWLADLEPGLVVLRASVGRYGEERDLQREDADLVAAVHGDLVDALGLRGRPVATRVTRWGGGLPQYAVGHLDRVSRVRSAVAEVPGLEVCGAVYDGVGIAACIATAQAAVGRLVRELVPGAIIGA
jgi:protoporphyrinogen/coproporphyrinogen III oxidase